MRGVEPPRAEAHRHLKPARLPIPPHPRHYYFNNYLRTLFQLVQILMFPVVSSRILVQSSLEIIKPVENLPGDCLMTVNYVNKNEGLNNAECYACDYNCEDCIGCINVETEALSLIKLRLTNCPIKP